MKCESPCPYVRPPLSGCPNHCIYLKERLRPEEVLRYREVSLERDRLLGEARALVHLASTRGKRPAARASLFDQLLTED